MTKHAFAFALIAVCLFAHLVAADQLRPVTPTAPTVREAFGFKVGQSLDEVKQMVPGLKAQPELGRGVYQAGKLPSGDNVEFENYAFTISPTKGLCRLLAVGRDITSGSGGGQLRQQFEAIVSKVTPRWGPPTHRLDYLDAGSIWNESQDFMMGLVKKERTLSAVWGPSEQGSVVVAAHASSQNEGYVNLVYEFAGMEACQADLKIVY